MPQQNALELAKQGNPQAIAVLMNRALNSKGIKARTRLTGSSLHVMLEAEHLPNQKALVAYISKSVGSLKAEAIENLVIYGRRSGDEFPEWTEHVNLVEPISEPQKPIVVKDPIAQPALQKTVSQPRVNNFKLVIPQTAAAWIGVMGLGLIVLFTAALVLNSFQHDESTRKIEQATEKIKQAASPSPTDGDAPGTKTISKAELGAEYPFTVPSGKIECIPPKAIVFETGGTAYAVNGTAEAKGYAEIRPIWKDNPAMPGYKINIGPVIQMGLSLCDPQAIPQAATPGIGVSRNSVQSALEKPQIGFKFEKDTPINGQQRVVGKSKDYVVVVELVGPPENLRSATIITGVPDYGVPKTSIADMKEFIKRTVPGWSEGASWLDDNIDKPEVVNGVFANQGFRHIEMKNDPNIGLMLTVSTQNTN